MELKVISINEDKTNEIYASDECQQLIDSMNEYYPKIGFNKPWIGYFVFRNKEIVGAGGFTGQPKDGKVEIAYGTFKEFEGQGVASFTCKELISITKLADPTITIIAKTAPEHNASAKILQNNRFKFSEIVQDDGIGDAWLWTLLWFFPRHLLPRTIPKPFRGEFHSHIYNSRGNGRFSDDEPRRIQR